MNCVTVDELAAAYAVGAVEPAEDVGVSEHLATCDQPHLEARDLIDGGALLGASVDPVAPSSGLRDRLMATVAATPQEHRPAPEPVPIPVPSGEQPAAATWWRGMAPLALAAVALVLAIGVGIWNVNLRQEIAQRDHAIGAIASADAVHQVSGSAGSGLLLESDGGATFVADELAALPAGQLYELWLIGPDGTPVAVGTLEETGGLAMVPLEQEIGAATTFAVTVEAERVDAPTGDVVLQANLEG